MRTPLLQVENLSVTYSVRSGSVTAVRNVSFEIAPGEVLAVVGETGCGKSTLAVAILGLPGSRGRIESGEIRFEDLALAGLNESRWRRIRGAGIGIIFQDARSSLNPVLTVGAHLTEAVMAHHRMPLREAKRLAATILAEVGIPDQAFYMKRYPAELSGGLCQRVAIALAVCNRPRLLIADEPTSALDPTLQRQILDLLTELKRRHGLAVLLISHDLSMVSEFADSVSVMYHGRFVEHGPASEVLARPAHPYTRALVRCVPDIQSRRERLATIAGVPPAAAEEIPGCGFAPRCEYAEPACSTSLPAMRPVSEEHSAACTRGASIVEGVE